MPAKIEFGTGTVTITSVDESVVVYSIAPVVTDEKVVVTHSDGSKQEFDKPAA